MQSLLQQHPNIFACPKCRAAGFDPSAPRCASCRHQFPIDSGIPLLFYPHGASDVGDVTETVKGFYEENPFPNYDDMGSRESLKRKAMKGIFARLLDEQLPRGALILEAGCGTGQLSNFLAMN